MLKIFSRQDANAEPVDPGTRILETLGDFELPNFEAAILRILEILRDPNAEPEEIGAALQTSPGLAIRLLKLVNSAAFGLSSQVNDLAHASNILGRARIESLVLGLAVRNALPRPQQNCFDPSRFWRGSFRRAALAKALAEELHPARAAESFTVGLLQDMAIPVLAMARAEDYGPVLEQWMSDTREYIDLARVEAELLNTTHAEVGTLLGLHWSMPDDLVEGIENHHGFDDEGLPAVQLVALLRDGETEMELERFILEATARFELHPDEIIAAIKRAFRDADELVLNLD